VYCPFFATIQFDQLFHSVPYPNVLTGSCNSQLAHRRPLLGLVLTPPFSPTIGHVDRATNQSAHILLNHLHL